MKRQALRLLFLGISVLSALGPAFLVLSVLNAFNPMQLTFVTTFAVRNDSGQSIELWPLGTAGGTEPHILPLFATVFPAIPHFGSGRFDLASGGTVEIHYDWDDINFTELLVRTGGGGYRSLAIDTDREAGCCWRHKSDVYVIPRIEDLAVASESSIAAVTQWPMMAGPLLFSLLATLLCVATWREQARLRRDPRTNSSAA